MTDAELDLLASSYLDGEATPEEVAMIERDPALLARVEELRPAQVAVRGPVAVPPGLKQQQLAAALAAFEVAPRAADRGSDVERGSDLAVVPDDSEPVIDLRARREAKERKAQDAMEAAGRMRWLSAVAGFLILAVGGVFLLSQVDGGDDGGDFATGAMADETTEAVDDAAGDAAANDAAGAAELAPASDGDAVAGDEAATTMAQALESESMAADAEEDFALDEEAEDAASDEAIEESAEDSAATGSEAQPLPPPIVRNDLPDAGFFADEPVASYPIIPTSDELVRQVDLPWRTPDSSTCAADITIPDGGEVIAYLPIEVTDPDGTTRVVEALYVVAGNESQVLLAQPDGCGLLANG